MGTLEAESIHHVGTWSLGERDRLELPKAFRV